MSILGPNAVRNDELLRMNVHETGLFEPLLQLGARTALIADFLERTSDFIEITFESGILEAAVCRVREAVPILKFNPTSWFE
mgnify:CR=1 FL=1